MSIKVEIKGHGIQQLSRFMRGFVADIKRVNERSAKRVGLKAEREAVLHITSQDLGWAPNSEKYKAWKLKKGQSDKTLVATSTYLQSITSKFDEGRVFVGVSKDAKASDGESMVDIAAVLEFGSMRRGIPPRPLWSVVLRDIGEWVKRENYFVTEIVKELKLKYGQQVPTTEVVSPNYNLKTPPAVQTGSRGGRFHISASGRKVYHRKP